MTLPFPYAGLYTDHPSPPIEPRDPLTFFDERWAQVDREGTPHQRLRIAYAARWETIPERTWSGSASQLLIGLGDIAETNDIGVHFPAPLRNTLRAVSLRYRNGRLKSSWNNSRITNAYMDRVLIGHTSSKASDNTYDVALTIDSLAVLPVPYFIYYDVSWDALLATADTPERYITSYGVTPARMRRMQERQRMIYEKATGIFTMSRWFARSLTEQSGLAPGKVHVIHPGMNTPDAVAPKLGELPVRLPVRRKLLYIGRMYKLGDFYRKGGDLVVSAFEILRKEHDPEITLTMVGLPEWPLHQPIPEGVTLPGVLPTTEITTLYDTHDLLVMPSRREPFGVVFAEAQARGLPCIARSAYGIPDVVIPGLSGALVDNDDPHELATAIADALADDGLYKSVRERAPQISDYFSWDRAAWEITQFIARHVA